MIHHDLSHKTIFAVLVLNKKGDITCQHIDYVEMCC